MVVVESSERMKDLEKHFSPHVLIPDDTEVLQFSPVDLFTSARLVSNVLHTSDVRLTTAMELIL